MVWCCSIAVWLGVIGALVLLIVGVVDVLSIALNVVWFGRLDFGCFGLVCLLSGLFGLVVACC